MYIYIYNVDECDNPNEQPSSNGILRCQHFIYIHHPSSIIHHPSSSSSSSSSSPSSPPPSSSAAATSFGYIHYYKEICIMYYIYIYYTPLYHDCFHYINMSIFFYIVSLYIYIYIAIYLCIPIISPFYFQCVEPKITCFSLPIGSMYAIYMVTWIPSIYPQC